MILWILLLIIAIIALIFATIIDLRTKEVPNWLTYSLITSGIGIRLLYSLIYKDYQIIFYGIIGLIIAIIFANIMYYTKQWGGGDCKLLMGLGALFGNYEIIIFNPNINLPFLLLLILNIFLFGSIYGIIYAIILAVKNYEKFKTEWQKQNHTMLFIGIFLGILIIIISLIIFEGFIKYVGFLLGLLLILLSLILNMLKTVENSCMYKKVNINKLTEGDWLAQDIMFNKKILISKKIFGINSEHIKILKKYKIRNVIIKEGIAFVPGFLIGFIITIIFGNVIF